MFIFLTSANEPSEDRVERQETLLKDIADGHTEALSQLYHMEKASVYGFALSILKNTHDAQDVLQSCFVQIWQHAGSYRPKGKPMAWVLTIAKNLCYMKLRERTRFAERESAQDEWTPAPDDTAQTVEDKAVLAAALQVLTDEERQIVMLHVVSGMKFREISSLLDMVTATVLSKYHRAINKMKQRLEEETL